MTKGTLIKRKVDERRILYLGIDQRREGDWLEDGFKSRLKYLFSGFLSGPAKSSNGDGGE